MSYPASMQDETDEARAPQPDGLLRAYEEAVLEFNLATVPLFVAMTGQLRPLAADVAREESARMKVVEARRRVWAAYDQE